MRRPLVRISVAAAVWVVAALTETEALPVRLLSQARLGPHCFDQSNIAAALDCWLIEHPDVAAAMQYHDSTFSGGPWPSWPLAVKTQFRQYFAQMVLWYWGGMPGQFPHQFQVPIPSQGPPDPVWGFSIAESVGRQWYLSQAANNLAAELTAAFPWTIATYSPVDLRLLLAMDQSIHFVSNAIQPGYYVQAGVDTPSVPGAVVRFFKTRHLLGADAADTIARLFGWERRLTHFYAVPGDPTQNVYPYFWGPESPPIPDSTIVRGTTYAGPGPAEFGHFTAGCSGTMEFMKSVLRDVNIPVQTHWVPVCAHATPIFPTVGLAMSHGDDPYDRLGWVTAAPGFPAPADREYLIPATQLDQIFPPGQTYDECEASTGIHVADIAIQYASDILLDKYCDDLASGATHATGAVFELMRWYYPLQTLENVGLWTNLEAKATATNHCGP